MTHHQTDLWKLGALLFAGAIAIWLLFLLASPPRFPGGDVTCFKDPGVNLAQGRGLVEVITPANPTLVPKFYSNYPPLFPAVYGAYVSIFGIGAKADSIFDFVLSAAASVAFWFSVTPRHAAPGRRSLGLILLGILVLMLPVGPFWTQRERPDAMGFITMMASLWALRDGLTPKRVALSAFIAGLGSLISPFTFAMNGLALAIIILIEGEPLQSLRHPLKGRARLVAAAAAGVTLPFGSLFLIQWLNDPDSIARFVANATGKSTSGRAGTGYLANLLAGDLGTYFGAFRRFDSFRYKWMLAHLIAVAAFTTFHLLRHHVTIRSPQSWMRPAGVLILAGVPLIVFPYQPCYMSLTAAMVLVLFVLLSRLGGEPGARQGGWVATAGVGVLALVAVPFMIREFVAAFQARDSYRTAVAAIQRIQLEAPDRIPVVATNAPFYFLFKQPGFEAVEVAYLTRPEDIAATDLFAFNTGGEASYQFPTWWEADRMELVHHVGKIPDLVVFGITIPDISLFGINIYRSRATWEADIYRFKRLPTGLPGR